MNNMKNFNQGKGIISFILVILIVILFVGVSLIYYLRPENITITQESRILNLSNQGLITIPSYIFRQTDIEELNLSHNSLTGAVPSQIRQLQNLKILDFSYNKMTGVPAEIGQLQNLQILDLSYNQLTGLPYELGNLQNLKTLNLKGNSYSKYDLDFIQSKLPPTTNIITK